MARRDKLREEIASCEKNTRGFKIAGISTLAATGIGVVGNIELHNRIKDAEKNGGGRGGAGGGHGLGHISMEQKVDIEYETFAGLPCDDLCGAGYNCSQCTCSE